MRLPILLAAVASLSCAHPWQPSKDKTLCAESRDLVCLTTTTCTMDESRGCRVCQCSSAARPGVQREDYGQPTPPRDRNQPP